MSRRQRATGCVRLAKAIRETIGGRRVTLVGCKIGETGKSVSFELVARLINFHAAKAGSRIRTSRSQVSQWCHAHRAINADQLYWLASVLGVDFSGARQRRSPHHALPVMCADLRAGPIVVTCRSTGNVIYSDAAE